MRALIDAADLDFVYLSANQYEIFQVVKTSRSNLNALQTHSFDHTDMAKLKLLSKKTWWKILFFFKQTHLAVQNFDE